jgi:hypothetical protein
MVPYLAIACFGIAALAFLKGFITEYRQSRESGPYSIQPTLQWAVAAAVFVPFGLWFLPLSIPWWAFPLALMSAVFTFVFGIWCASARQDSRGE